MENDKRWFINMENTKIVYQCVRFNAEETRKVFHLVKKVQPFLSHVKEELHATFKFYGFKQPASFGDEGVFPIEWVKEKKEVKFFVKQLATELEDGEGVVQGVFLEPHPDSKEIIAHYYQNENPLHLTISLAEGVPPVRTGKIPDDFKKDVVDENGNTLLITGFIDVFTKNGTFTS